MNINKIDKNYSYLFIFLIAGFILWQPMLFGVFAIQDDHELLYYMGSDKNLSFLEIFTSFYDTEVLGNFGTIARFRPSYYFLRLTEIFLWADHVFLWYAFRIITLSLFFSSVFLFIKKYFGIWLSILFILIELVMPYWIQIVTRLGPGEFYVCLGIALILISFTYDNLNLTIKSLLISLGTVICSGCKESLVVITLIPILFFYYYNSKLNVISKAFLIISKLFAFIVLLATGYLLFIFSGKDIYGISIHDRFFSLFNIFKSKEFIILSLMGIAFLLKKNVLVNKKFIINRQSFFEKSNIWFFLSCIYLFYIYQYFFYNGNYPSNMRYDIPGLPLYHLYILIVWQLLFHKIKISSNYFLKLSFILLLLIMFIYASIYQRHKSLRATLWQHNYFDIIKNASDYLKSHENSTLVIKSYCGGDHEHIISIKRFLLYEDVKNKFMLQIDNQPSPYCPKNKKSFYPIDQSLEKIVILGGDGFIPYSQDKNFECFSIGINGPHNQSCSGALYISKQKYKLNFWDLARGYLK